LFDDDDFDDDRDDDDDFDDDRDDDYDDGHLFWCCVNAGGHGGHDDDNDDDATATAAGAAAALHTVHFVRRSVGSRCIAPCNFSIFLNNNPKIIDRCKATRAYCPNCYILSGARRVELVAEGCWL
jgi:hypothetical protein